MTLTREQRGWALLAAGAVVALGFHVLGGAYDGWALGLGSIAEPTGRHLLFLLYFTLFGTAAALLVAAGLLQAFHDDRWWPGWEDRPFLLRAVAMAVLVPVVLRLLVLGGQPITDDESLYRFAAELLLQGRVTAESHPWRLFFSHAFLVNDGEMYPQYFLGWPGFLAVGVALGVPGFVNAALSALTVPPLYLLVRELTGRLQAQVVTVLFLLSPMLQLLAATELSHTSALFALAWTAWLAHRSVAEPGAWWPAALLGLAFSVAFFIRPLTAVGIGAPFLVFWAVGWWRAGRPAAPAAAFLAPSAAMAGLFLLVNQAQTGSPLQPAYLAWDAYTRADGFRFSGRNPMAAPEVPNLVFAGAARAVRTVSLGLARLNYALLGWPSAFLFLPLALGARRTGVLWASAGFFLLLHASLQDPGIDTVGPVHFTELALPVLVLTGVGLARGAAWVGAQLGEGGPGGEGAVGAPAAEAAPMVGAPGGSGRSAIGPGEGGPGGDAGGRAAEHLPAGSRMMLAAVAALILCNVVLYAPARLKAVGTVATLVSVPATVLERAGLENAVVFSSLPWALACNPLVAVPSRPFVFWWPVNEPGFTDDVLHANHLGTEMDRRLMATHFPDRTGWILHWDRSRCTLDLLPLDDPAAAEVPDGVMTVGPAGPVRWDPSHPPTGELPPEFSP